MRREWGHRAYYQGKQKTSGEAEQGEALHPSFPFSEPLQHTTTVPWSAPVFVLLTLAVICCCTLKVGKGGAGTYVVTPAMAQCADTLCSSKGWEGPGWRLIGETVTMTLSEVPAPRTAAGTAAPGLQDQQHLWEVSLLLWDEMYQALPVMPAFLRGDYTESSQAPCESVNLREAWDGNTLHVHMHAYMHNCATI